MENNPASSAHEEGVTADQNYLYVVANGLSQIVGYQVGADGSITQVTTAPVAVAPSAWASTETTDPRTGSGRWDACIFPPPGQSPPSSR